MPVLIGRQRFLGLWVGRWCRWSVHLSGLGHIFANRLGWLHASVVIGHGANKVADIFSVVADNICVINLLYQIFLDSVIQEREALNLVIRKQELLLLRPPK